MLKTYQPKAKEVVRTWRLYDAKGRVLGRLATEIATTLIGKNKRTYSPHMDSGDYVVVINAQEIVVTGKKEQDKVYYSHSGYPGGLRAVKYSDLKASNPAKIIQKAVKNMLPKNRLQADRMTRLKVFGGVQHPYAKVITK